MKIVELKFQDVYVPYAYGMGCTEQMIQALSQMNGKCFVVTDDTVASLYVESFCSELAKRCKVFLLLVNGQREGSKTLNTVAALAAEAIDKGIDRSSVIVAFGGGVVGNIAGLLAGLMYRGIRLVHVPTTLIAMHDSVLSLKQAVNFHGGRNVLGLYRQPHSILANIDYLSTLDQKDVNSGLVESIKNALAIVPEQIDELSELVHSILNGRRDSRSYLRLLELSISAKSAVMANDKFERREALVLEYGHTVGHAIELLHAQVVPAAEAIRHGEAVGIGMRVAGRIALARNLSYDDWLAHEKLLDAGGVMKRIPEEIGVQAVLERLHSDNKRGLIATKPDEIAMILLSAMGKPVITGDLPLAAVSLIEIEDALNALNEGQPESDPISASMSMAGRRR